VNESVTTHIGVDATTLPDTATLAAWCREMDATIVGLRQYADGLNTQWSRMRRVLAERVLAEVIAGREHLLAVEREVLGGAFAENTLLEAALRAGFLVGENGQFRETLAGNTIEILALVEQVCAEVPV